MASRLLSDPADTVLAWQAVPGPGELVCEVVRGDLAALSAGAGGVSLGSLTCIEQGSADASTAGNADSHVRAAGTGWS